MFPLTMFILDLSPDVLLLAVSNASKLFTILNELSFFFSFLPEALPDISSSLATFLSTALFKAIETFLISERLGTTCDAILVDLHGEATSEKNAFAHFVDGSVSAVLGTHTHIPTSDNAILPKGTAYQTDVGMTGDYNSVIGMDIKNPIHGFTKGYRAEGRFTPANGQISICGALIETDDSTGLAKNITSIKEM